MLGNLRRLIAPSIPISTSAAAPFAVAWEAWVTRTSPPLWSQRRTMISALRATLPTGYTFVTWTGWIWRGSWTVWPRPRPRPRQRPRIRTWPTSNCVPSRWESARRAAAPITSRERPSRGLIPVTSRTHWSCIIPIVTKRRLILSMVPIWRTSPGWRRWAWDPSSR